MANAKKFTDEEWKKISEAIAKDFIGPPETIWTQFNRKVAEDLKQRTGSYRPGWKTVQEAVVNGIDYQCPKCDFIGTYSEMKAHKCSITIDAVAYDVEEEKPQLPSGKEND